MLGSGGGGGGSAPGNPGAQGGSGGRGGGIVFISARELDVAGVISAVGEAGGTAPHAGFEEGGGGGGAGGSIKLLVGRATLGNGLVLAPGGWHGQGSNNGDGNQLWGGRRGRGRVRVEYCLSVADATDPPVEPVQLDCPGVVAPSPTPAHTFTATPTETNTPTPTPTPWLEPIDLAPGFIAEGNQAAAILGVALGAAGDVNGDGYDDVIFDAHYYDNGQVDEGRVFIYYGSASGLSAPLIGAPRAISPPRCLASLQARQVMSTMTATMM